MLAVAQHHAFVGMEIGGQHRSVYMAEKLAAYFHPNERVVLRHREQ